MILLGKVEVVSSSIKKQLNMTCSTKSGLMVADASFPILLWRHYFKDDQGYTVERNILYQDNRSTIILVKNGILSRSKRTKHTEARYF